MEKILHEPLLHFFLAGVCIFLLYAIIGPDTRTPDDNDIIVDKDRIDQLKAIGQRLTNREPTPDELGRLVEDYLFEELYYREARSLGLEQDDQIVRRRLVQKMTFLVESIAELSQPPAAELMEWYHAHPALYRTEPTLSIKHIYFSQDRRGEQAGKDALSALSRLDNISETAEQVKLGDAFMLNHEFSAVSHSQLSRLFGSDFATMLFTLPEGNWQGPVMSGYGYHLVYVFDLKKAKPIPFDESKTQILQDWQREKLEQAKKEMLDELKNKYEITYTREAQALLKGSGL